ncbi:hypothetical protein AGMMS50262_03940 [Bacteroidia bacterium]|nr:hypothetical protein AGMMS50262_03940 [Bacteroidia bacterium]
MVAKPFVKSQKNITKILTIQPQFYTQMAEILFSILLLPAQYESLQFIIKQLIQKG